MKKLQLDVEPFITESDKNLNVIGSVLQCLISLPNFLNILNSQSKTEIFNCIFSFLQERHSLQDFKKYLEKKKKINFQDSFEVINTFIDSVKDELGYSINGLFDGTVGEIEECPNEKCTIPKEKERQFTSIELSFTQCLRILYVPYEFNKSLKYMSQTSEIKTDFLLVYEKYDKFNIIDKENLSPKYPNIFAFEIPKVKSGNGLAIVQLNSDSKYPITEPIICEVSLRKTDLEESIKKRIKNLFKAKNSIKIKVENGIDDFVKSGQNNICLKAIQVTVTEYTKVLFDRKSKEEEETTLNLKEIFDSYISLSKLDHQSICTLCHNKGYFYTRKRLTKLPKILIFRIKRSEERDQCYEQIEIPEFISLETAEYNKMEIIGNPSLYEGEEDIDKFELYAVLSQYGDQKNPTTFTDVKRGNKWHRILENKTRPLRKPPTESSSSAYILFYVMTNNEKKIDSDNHDQHFLQKSAKQKVNYIYNGRKVLTIDKNEIKNATDIIKFFRNKLQNNNINGFEIMEKKYYVGDNTLISDIFPVEITNTPTINFIFDKPRPPSESSSPTGRLIK